MGCPKALLDAAGATFLSRLAATFASVGARPLAVVGAEAARIRAAHPGVECVENPAWASGQFSSVQVGLRAAGAARVVVQPVDAPLLTAGALRHFLKSASGHPAAFAAHRSAPGHPVVLDPLSVEAVLSAPASSTLAAALAALQAVAIEVDDPWVTKNLNTPEDYAAVFGHPPRVL